MVVRIPFLYNIGPWGNKNGLPSMKVGELQIFGNKTGSMACQKSNLNTPGNQTHLSHSILELGEFPFPIIGLLG